MIVRSFHYQGVRYSFEKHKCGRSNCTKCPHGPYWRSYVWVGTRTKGIYIGKNLPAGVPDLGDTRKAPKLRVTLSPRQAAALLGITLSYSRERAWKSVEALRAKCRKKGESGRMIEVELDEAYRVLAAYHGW